MNLQEFNTLTLTEKQEVINKFGEHKSIAAGKDFNYLLYSFSDFFVETLYNKKENKIEDIVAFAENQINLNKYIDTENKLIELFQE